MTPGPIPDGGREQTDGSPHGPASGSPEVCATTRPTLRQDFHASASVIVVGGVAVDIVTSLPRPLTPGGFVQAAATAERIGGCAVNIATGLTGAGCACVLVGCVGTDARGKWLRTELAERGLETRIRAVPGATPASLIMVEPSGERTIVGLTDDLLSEIDMASISLGSHDVVVFPQWRPGFGDELARARAAGCRTVVGLRALQDPAAPEADLAIGSSTEVADPSTLRSQLHRFGAIVVTEGALGSRAYLPTGDTHVRPAAAASPIDATGAGDAYLAGLVHQWTHGVSLPRAMDVATVWGALATERRTSTPPPWSDVQRRLNPT
ncbi:carbohydrate kinase family protein [Streptomyces sp. NPDC093801]|uniref:carbohydrate kinase family protein n=1 Tax=Streptomyces sp. NPDC093801 TaxID=3155203 RepID=UPI00344FC91F